ITKLLQEWTSADIEITEGINLRESYQPWFDWFAETYDQDVSELFWSADQDVDAFLKRIEAIDWSPGEAERGKAIFAERQCTACHTVQTRIGPHLNGITKRFSVADLFAEIIDPNRNLSPAYAPRVYETKSGESYFGFPVYNSPATTIVQTGASTTVRLTSDDPYTERKSDTSLMPAGLLEGLSDQQLADFYAFIKTL
ncbi:MAG: c-type cytochrome, partial [Limisphaerales bacterium]